MCQKIVVLTFLLQHLLQSSNIIMLEAASTTRNINRQQLKTIEKNMDPNAEPCNDYYQYACGKWKNVHANAEYYETIGLIDYQVDQEYAKLLNDLRRKSKRRRGGHNEYMFLRKLSDYYKSCLRVYAYIPKLYLDWLQEYEQLEWPTVLPNSMEYDNNEKQQQQHYDWLKMLAILRKYGLNTVFLEETVVQQSYNARASSIDLDKPVLNGGFQTMPHKGFLLIMEYLNITNIPKRDELWKDIHAFEIRLKSLDFVEDTKNESSEENALMQRVITLKDLQMPFLIRYINIVLGYKADVNMKLTIQNLPYMRLLFTILADYENEFICRYLMLRFLWYLNIDGPRNFLKNDCVSHTRSMMPLAMTWLYEHNNPDLVLEKTNIEILFQKLLQHFTQTIQNNSNNFDANILRFLQDKIDKMRIKIGNLPHQNTSHHVENFYMNLQIESWNFYGNHLRLLQHFTSAKHKRLNELLPHDDTFFHLEDPETGASSSPYYLLRSNIVIVPLTLLHRPIYHAKLHDVFKYSSLGFLLSHEITHGFDDSGVEFDKIGNMRGPSDNIKSNVIFDTNLNCLRSHKPQIVDEKIADVSGLRWAYESYFKLNMNNSGGSSSRNNSTEQFTSFSPEHLFFLNFAQFFCGVPTTNTRDIEFSEHGSDKERVLDALANFAEFSRVYNCPLGSPMNPVRKCQLWR